MARTEDAARRRGDTAWFFQGVRVHGGARGDRVPEEEKERTEDAGSFSLLMTKTGDRGNPLASKPKIEQTDVDETSGN